jgi:hypothetical protein
MQIGKTRINSYVLVRDSLIAEIHNDGFDSNCFVVYINTALKTIFNKYPAAVAMFDSFFSSNFQNEWRRKEVTHKDYMIFINQIRADKKQYKLSSNDVWAYGEIEHFISLVLSMKERNENFLTVEPIIGLQIRHIELLLKMV